MLYSHVVGISLFGTGVSIFLMNNSQFLTMLDKKQFRGTLYPTNSFEYLEATGMLRFRNCLIFWEFHQFECWKPHFCIFIHVKYHFSAENCYNFSDFSTVLESKHTSGFGVFNGLVVYSNPRNCFFLTQSEVEKTEKVPKINSQRAIMWSGMEFRGTEILYHKIGWSNSRRTLIG